MPILDSYTSGYPGVQRHSPEQIPAKHGFNRIEFSAPAIFNNRCSTEFEQELMQFIELPDLIQKLREHITSGLNPSSLHIFLQDPAQ